MATIKDVAKKAGVALSTASYALNNKGKVSVETKNKVLVAAEELGYVHNGTARNIQVTSTNTIGVFIWNVHGPIFGDMVKGMHDFIVKEKGYDFITGSIVGGTNSTACKYMSEKKVDAAIVLCSNIDDAFLQSVASEKLPIVVLDREIEHPYIHSVILDNENGAYMAVEHMIRLGIKNIACISGGADSLDSSMRLQGYKRALEKNGLSYNDEMVISGWCKQDGGYYAMKHLLEDFNDIEGVFCVTDEMAIGAMKAIQESGLSIPKDIAIVGFDDMILAKYVQPSLTTVRNPTYKWGVAAAQTLFNIIEKQDVAPKTIIPTQLIIRNSCGIINI
ncbi:LacI family DNA-binding transcriptional regulator [Vallitalea okinawensis]|uniref:LacI family DNA-binding transcriptional regulator n=1 Tax=Vallitalea okinawensis TaxID=2078660 RepID=UPI000CFCD450|nr:LacI family DNA-binding transcriptional regulator [Vallitalea okinawensis]